MISPTGKNDKGFTFVEVMVALVVLSIGIIGVYKALMVSLDYEQHTVNRLYALHLLDDKVEELQLQFETGGAIPSTESKREVRLYSTPVDFTSVVRLDNVKELQDIVKAGISLSWVERGRRINQSRAVYLYHRSGEKNGKTENASSSQ